MNTDGVAKQGYVSPLSQRGWADIRAGRGFPPDYDGWPELDQRNYENGRLRAIGWRQLFRKRIPAEQTVEIVAAVAANIRGFIPPSRDPLAPPEPLPPPPATVY